ncbi:MAG: hypothetical protein L3J01_02595 [Thiomicrorhabdus sp.]|nr:hypothetical protein [Thiomicrorhabdus sp.]
MNCNYEKWLQLIFSQHHPKVDGTLSLIRHVLTQLGCGAYVNEAKHSTLSGQSWTSGSGENV